MSLVRAVLSLPSPILDALRLFYGKIDYLFYYSLPFPRHTVTYYFINFLVWLGVGGSLWMAFLSCILGDETAGWGGI